MIKSSHTRPITAETSAWWSLGCFITELLCGKEKNMSKVRLTLKHAGGSTHEIDIIIHPEWAPLGAERFMQLVDAKYFDNCPLYRNIPDFIVQWGIPANPAEWTKWGANKIKDDPVKHSNTLGTLSFATSGPDARGSQIFINLNDNTSQLDAQGFSPFAELADPATAFPALAGCATVQGVDQVSAKEEGAAYFAKFPSLSVWVSAAKI